MSTTGAPPRSGRIPAGDDRARRLGYGPAIGIGIVAVGITLACGELLAAVTAWLGVLDAAASPFGALGAGFIAVTPEWLKDVGIGLFGQNDKVALAVSMVVTFLLVGALIGVVGRIDVRPAAGIGVVMLVVTAVAILSRPDAGAADLIPIVLGGVAGVGFLVHVLDLAQDPYPDLPASGDAHPGATTAGGDAAPSAFRIAGRLNRRRAMQVTGIAALAAIAAGALSRAVPGVVNVQANRAGVTLPPVVPGGGPTGTRAPTAAGSTASSTPATPAGAVSTAAPAGMVVPPALPPNVNPAVPGLTPYVTPDTSFYRVDTAFTLPRVTTDAWRLKVHGLVQHPFEISWSDLLAMPQVERWITLTCVSNVVGGNLAGNAAWQGVRIADLLARAGVRPGADCVYSTSADHFTVTTPLSVLTDGRDALLAIGMNGQPLPIEHGFPVRMVVPGLYGYVSATKWVVDMEVTTFADTTAYWTERGWAPRGPVKTASRIDTPGYDVTVDSGTVPVAGVAWAQHRGISAVQVQVDDEPWREAELYGAASADTWVQWVFRWDTRGAASGRHRLRCRAVDGAGAVQDGTVRPVAPNGATGYDTVTVITR